MYYETTTWTPPVHPDDIEFRAEIACLFQDVHPGYLDALLQADPEADWEAATPRHTAGPKSGKRPGAVAQDGGTARKRARIELVLYTSAASEKCQRALKAVLKLLREYDPEQVSFSVRDLSEHPSAGDEDAVIFTPTLVKRGPGARTYIVGDLDRPRMLADLLDVSGVRKLREDA